jgi:hypothetical protein
MSQLGLPSLERLNDDELRAVFAGLSVSAGAWETSTERPGRFMADLTDALVRWVLDELDRRGVARDTFADITPEDFQ